MTRKELLDSIRREMPEDLSEKEKTAFIMWKIAENRSFSEHYYWGDSSTCKKMYTRAMNPKDIEPENKRKLICVTASRLFKYIATELGLDVCYVGEDSMPMRTLVGLLRSGEHVYPAVILSDGSLIKCDIQRDLPNIQTGCRWRYFGTRGFGEEGILSEISSQELDEIMKRIGYLNNRDMYTDEYCRKKVSERNKLTTVTEIVKSIFEDERLNSEVRHTNIVETYKFYMKVMDIYLSKECKDYNICRKGLKLTRYLDKFFMFPCKLKREEQIRYTICTYTYEENGDVSINLLSRTTKKMIRVSIEEFSFYQEQGLIIPTSGTKFLRRKLKEFRKAKNQSDSISEKTPRVDLEELVNESADDLGLVL